MFKGASWQEAACLLRLLYSSPREAAPANLAVLAAAGLLPGVARLAHCLDCQRVLTAVDEFLQGRREAFGRESWSGMHGAGCTERDARSGMHGAAPPAQCAFGCSCPSLEWLPSGGCCVQPKG